MDKIRRYGSSKFFFGVGRMRQSLSKTSLGYTVGGNGRQFKLECRSNSAGTFIRCTVRDSSAKRHCLIFPEGKGLANGWALLAKKLRSLGVDYKKKVEVRKRSEKEVKKVVKGNSTSAASYVEKVILGLNGTIEKVRISLGKEEIRDKLRRLDCCLVGWRDKGSSPIPDLKSLKRHVWTSWDVSGSLNVAELGRGLWMFEFESQKEAERILRRGSRRFRDFGLSLKKWS